MAVLAFALMPNHFHLVLWPQVGSDISAFMRWLMNAHVRRHYRFGELWGTGHLYQGRYKAFPIQTDHHLLTVLRYVEANPLRARLVSRAEAWNWGSLSRSTCQNGRSLLTASPVRRPDTWTDIVNEALPTSTYQALRTSAQRQIPFGEPEWIRYVGQAETATRNDALDLSQPGDVQPPT
jgi:putative transposase